MRRYKSSDNTRCVTLYTQKYQMLLPIFFLKQLLQLEMEHFVNESRMTEPISNRRNEKQNKNENIEFG